MSIIQKSFINKITDRVYKLGKVYKHYVFERLLRVMVYLHTLYTTYNTVPCKEWQCTNANGICTHSYMYVQTPFSVKTKFYIHGIVALYPQWFYLCKRTTNKYSSASAETLSNTINFSLSSSKFSITNKNCTTITNTCTSEVGCDILETYLIGIPNSSFARNYPQGINISQFGNKILKNCGVNKTPSSNTLNKLKKFSIKVYQIYPFILHHTLQKLECYPKDTLQIRILMDETFDEYLLNWDDDI